LLYFALVALHPWYQIAFRVSESWPHHHVFLLERHAPVVRGDLVMFVMETRHVAKVRPGGYLRNYLTVGRQWMKRLVGLPGDSIRIVNREVFVNEESMGTVLSKDLMGNPIDVADLPAVIPPGWAFVSLTDHPRSLDSRYIGLLPVTDIQAKVRGIL